MKELTLRRESLFVFLYSLVVKRRKFLVLLLLTFCFSISAASAGTILFRYRGSKGPRDTLTLYSTRFLGILQEDLLAKTVVNDTGTYRLTFSMPREKICSIFLGGKKIVSKLYLEDDDSICLSFDRDNPYSFDLTFDKIGDNERGQIIFSTFEGPGDYAAKQKTYSSHQFFRYLDSLWAGRSLYLRDSTNDFLDHCHHRLLVKDLKAKVAISPAQKKGFYIRYTAVMSNRSILSDDSLLSEALRTDLCSNEAYAGTDFRVYLIQEVMPLLVLRTNYVHHDTSHSTIREACQKYDVARNAFQGSAREDAAFFAIYHTVGNGGDLNILHAFDSLLQDYSSFCMDRSKVDFLKKLYTEKAMLVPGSEMPDFRLEDAHGKFVRLSDFKGKYVYLDFWGTWCEPCRAELPYFKEIIAQFSNRKDIVFISIALEAGGKEQWKKFLHRNRLEGIQLFSEGVFDSQAAKEYSISGVPSFFLIGKNGKLISAHPKRPSEKDVMPYLEGETKE